MNHKFDHIRSYRVQPRDRTWRSVKEKLANRKAKQKVAFYRNLSIAAGLIALLAIVFGLTSQFNYLENKVYSSNDLFHPDYIEDLPVVVDDPFYAYNKILEISEDADIFETSNGGTLQLKK